MYKDSVAASGYFGTSWAVPMHGMVDQVMYMAW